MRNMYCPKQNQIDVWANVGVVGGFVCKMLDAVADRCVAAHREKFAAVASTLEHVVVEQLVHHVEGQRCFRRVPSSQLLPDMG